jgi:drug/metabolite transporter (DMT)-like permease
LETLIETFRNSLNQPQQDNLKLAVVAILVACFGLSLGDALIKQQSASFVLWQIFVMRSLIVLPFLVYFVRLRSCATPIMPAHLGWTSLRSLILVLMWIFYFAALPHIELAVAAAAFYTLPIMITVFAAIFLREKITPAGWLAVGIGFVGTLLILQPQSDDFNSYALLPLVSALCYAWAMILTRSKCRHEKPTVLALWMNFGFVAVGGLALAGLYLWNPDADSIASNPFLFGHWTPMWLDEWRIMAILAMAIACGAIGAAYAYQNAPPSIVSTFDFSYVAFATTWGFVLFAEVPGPQVATGIILIVAAGALASWRRSA